jgi:hypothetical protein
MVSSTLPKLTKIPCAVSGPQVREAAVVAGVDGADGGAEHQVERPRLGEIRRAALRALQLLGGDRGVDLGQPLRVRPFCATKT